MGGLHVLPVSPGRNSSIDTSIYSIPKHTNVSAIEIGHGRHSTVKGLLGLNYVVDI